MIIHINGWPGTGKLTIARLLRARLGGRLVDNHTLLNAAEALFERSDPNWQALRRAVRAQVLGFARQLSQTALLILTDALADDADDRQIFDEYRLLAADRGCSLVSIVLDCSIEENLHRLLAPGRAELRKLVKSEVLLDLRRRYALLRPSGVPHIYLDVTELTPEQAAEALAARVTGSP